MKTNRNWTLWVSLGVQGVFAILSTCNIFSLQRCIFDFYSSRSTDETAPSGSHDGWELTARSCKPSLASFTAWQLQDVHFGMCKSTSRPAAPCHFTRDWEPSSGLTLVGHPNSSWPVRCTSEGVWKWVPKSRDETTKVSEATVTIHAATQVWKVLH